MGLWGIFSSAGGLRFLRIQASTTPCSLWICFLCLWVCFLCSEMQAVWQGRMGQQLNKDDPLEYQPWARAGSVAGLSFLPLCTFTAESVPRKGGEWDSFSVFQGDSPRGEMQMSEKKEIMFTYKYSSKNQPHLNAARCPLCCQWFRRCLFHMYFFIVIVFCHYVLCYFCCHSTQKTQLLVQSKCIKADGIYAPSAMRQDCTLTPAAVTWVSSNPAIIHQRSLLRWAHSLRWTRKHVKSHVYYLTF